MNATGSVLVDTSVVVDYLRQDPILHQKIDQVEDVYLPLTALGELLYGAHKSQQKGKALTQVQEFSRGCIIILPDEATADLYGQIKTDLAAAGKMIPENDVLDRGCCQTIRPSGGDAGSAFFLRLRIDRAGLVGACVSSANWRRKIRD